jgi:hypothetical protein
MSTQRALQSLQENRRFAAVIADWNEKAGVLETWQWRPEHVEKLPTL